jgi:hypothetical protein
MSQQSNKHHKNTSAGNINNDNADQVYDINDETGDLSAWEYLTKNYDDSHLYEEYAESVAPSKTATQNQRVIDEVEGSITCVQDLTEMGTVQPNYRPEAIPTHLHGVQYITNSSSCPDLSLLHHDHQLQHHQHLRNHPPLIQQHTVTSFLTTASPADSTSLNQTRSWSYPMQANTSGYPMSFTASPTPLLHSQNWTHPSTLQSQQPASVSEEYQRRQQFQYQQITSAPLHHHLFQPLNDEPLHQCAVPLHREWYTSLPSSSTSTSTSDQVFAPSVTLLDDFEPEPIHPAPLEAIRRANTSNATSVASINPSPTIFSRKKAPPHRSNPKGSSEHNIQDDEMNHLKLPPFIHEMLPPYQQHKNIKLLLRPLTPYNYFYRDERDNMVRNFTTEDDPLPPPLSDFTVTKMHALLYEHWYVDPVKQRRAHRKSHGRFSFATLSKTVAQRWHQLPKEGREFYQNVSFMDNVYHQQELRKIERSER